MSEKFVKNERQWMGVLAKIANDFEVDAFYLRVAFIFLCTVSTPLIAIYFIIGIFTDPDENDP